MARHTTEIASMVVDEVVRSVRLSRCSGVCRLDLGALFLGEGFIVPKAVRVSSEICFALCWIFDIGEAV